MRHLLSRAHFQAVLRSKPVANSEHFAFYRVELASIKEVIGQPRLTRASSLAGFDENVVGALLPKKWAKRAVTRNAIRRQIYRVSDELDQSASAFAYVVRMKKSLDPIAFLSASSVGLKSAMYQELLGLMRVTKPE